MLKAIFWLVEAVGMTLSLWLAAYLLVHGYRSPITRRTVLLLLAVAAGFFIALYGHDQPAGNLERGWIVAFTLALMAWYNLTHQLLTARLRRRVRWMALLVYGFGTLKIVANVLMAWEVQFRDDPVGLNIVPFGLTLYAVIDLVFLLTAAIGTLFNYRLGQAGGYGPYFAPLWLASLLGAAAVLYGMLWVVAPNLAVPRTVQEMLLVAAIVFFGYGVARYQTFVEFRPFLRDLPTSALATLAVAAVYAGLARWAGLPTRFLGPVMALAVVTHAAFDQVRESLDRLLNQHLSAFRQSLRQLERQGGDEDALPAHLQVGLEMLQRLLGAPAGFVAVKRGDTFTVLTSTGLLGLGHQLTAEEVSVVETTMHSNWGSNRSPIWLVPAFASEELMAVIGLARRRNGIVFGPTDVDLMDDVAHWVGRLVASQAQQNVRRTGVLQLAEAIQSGRASLQAQAETLITTLQNQPDRAFTRLIETALQHLSDYAWLGASPLVTHLGLPGVTNIERAKELRQKLLEAVESLRPAARPPDGVPPRYWQAYMILHDAYVDHVPNREIMARLYVSEGTYNRVRRRALHAVAQALQESHQQALSNQTSRNAGLEQTVE
jgi:hypothetical protein